MTDDDAVWRELFDEMARRFREAPTPSLAAAVRSSPAYTASNEAVVVVYGWTNRVIRTGQAVLRLGADGFTAEASPLLRSMFEHGMALHWIDDQPGHAFHALFRAWQGQLKLYAKVEAPDWQLDDETLALIDDLLEVETDESSKRADNLLSTAHRAKHYGLGVPYRAWLIETWTSHATLISAQIYYETEGESEYTLLGDSPKAAPDLALACAMTGLAALEIYSRVLPTDFFASDLVRWRARLGADALPAPRSL